MPHFDYSLAFSRNIGWFTAAEQAKLRSTRVAIAGLGGVGGNYALTFARLGFGAFSLADFDSFDIANFNRQVGATVSTIGVPKLDAIARMSLDINPELDIRRFPEGVTDDASIDAFLDGVSVYIDGLDFFAFNAREKVFRACHKKGIPAVTVAPLGMGAALLVFAPGGMSFDDYFGFQGLTELEKGLRFLVGLSPRLPHASYLVDATTVDLERRMGPSTFIACQLCAGVAAAEAVKIVLGRGKVRLAPHGTHFDGYRNKTYRTWRPGGYRNPLQRLIYKIAKQRLIK